MPGPKGITGEFVPKIIELLKDVAEQFRYCIIYSVNIRVYISSVLNCSRTVDFSINNFQQVRLMYCRTIKSAVQII